MDPTEPRTGQPKDRPPATLAELLKPGAPSPEALAAAAASPQRARWKNPYAALPQMRWVVQGAYALFIGLVGVDFFLFYRQAMLGEALTRHRPPAVEAFLPISALLGLKRLVLTGKWDEVHPAGLALFIGLVGVDFYLFYRQAMLGEALTRHRPPAVEAFLPISALLGLKRLVLTGKWDEVHPAGLALFVAAILSAMVAGKAFCGWICPVGTLSRALEALGGRLFKRTLRRREVFVPRWLDLVLTAPKYLLLGFFAWFILLQMDVQAIESFIHAPYNYAADAKMLEFFLHLSGFGAAVLGVLALLSLVIKNFWCRYLCPYGALLGVASLVSPLKVRRDAATCIDCKKCTRVCPSEIRVHAARTVWSAECIGCTSCIAACPVESCLTVTRKAEKGWPAWLVPALAVGVMLGVWVWASLTGHWVSAIPERMFARIYSQAAWMLHP